MSWHPLHDRDALRALCRRDPGRYLFHLGDLDPVEWPHSEYLSHGDCGPLILIYRGLPMPCVIAFGPAGALGKAMDSALPLLPEAGFFHGFDEDLRRLERVRRVTRRGCFRRMLWHGLPAGALPPATVPALRLGPDDLEALLELYAHSHPEAHFEPVQLEKGLLFGIREAGQLLSVAGVHVLSDVEGVAMLGNIATRFNRRGEGLARSATAALLAELSGRVRWIGLNVHADNKPARRLYARLGFRDCFFYEEAAFTAGA